MARRSRFLSLALTTGIISYALAIGTTFNGILLPDLSAFSLTLIGLLVMIWLFIHWRRGWAWPTTPLDGALPLWIAAFAVSLLANGDVWRRIIIGLWYVGAYVGVWYMLQDVITNRGITRETLVDALLIGGLMVMFFGYLQLRGWFTDTLPLILSGALPFSLPRPVSVFGNPNFLGGFLVILIPFAFSRVVSAVNPVGRAAITLYGLLALLLLFLTFSRGAWVGALAGLAVWAALTLAPLRLLSRTRLTAVWRQRTRLVRFLIIGAIASSVGAVSLVVLLLIGSLNTPGRQADYRTGIWQVAVDLFLEKPLTGHGLFTFGRGLARLQSIPPETPHSHAHSAPLHIAAELGLPGLLALAASGVVMFRALRINWRLSNQQRHLLTGAAAAAAGFAVHQLTDIPAMMPAIALSGLLALALATAPIEPLPLTGTRRQSLPSLGLAIMWLTLVTSGLWSSVLHSRYETALRYGASSGDYRGAAEQLQPVIAADPTLALYNKEQAFLWGMAASAGDLEAARSGIASYENFIRLEPGYAIAWANLAALYWQTGQPQRALQAAQRAFDLAPRYWTLAYNLGQYAEWMGSTDLARSAYQQVLNLYPDAVLYPEWEQSPLRVALTDIYQLDLSIPARTANLIGIGRTDTAYRIWVGETRPPTTASIVLDAVLTTDPTDTAALAARWSAAARLAIGASDQAWIHWGMAWTARLRGDDVTAERELQTARQMLQRAPLDADFIYGISIAYAQFLRLGIPRQFLPQVYFPIDDPALVYLLNHT